MTGTMYGFCEAGWCKTSVFLVLMVRTVCAGRRETIYAVLHLFLSGCVECAVVSKQKVTHIVFLHLDICLKPLQVEELAIRHKT